MSGAVWLLASPSCPLRGLLSGMGAPIHGLAALRPWLIMNRPLRGLCYAGVRWLTPDGRRDAGAKQEKAGMTGPWMATRLTGRLL
jgi:hypothetical protein